MNDRVLQKLVVVLDSESPSILEEPERLEAFLRDYCGDCRREIAALIAALEEDVPRDLKRMRGEPYPILSARLADKLHEERSLIPEAAQWAVESWAVALKIVPSRKPPVVNAPAYEPPQPPANAVYVSPDRAPNSTPWNSQQSPAGIPEGAWPQNPWPGPGQVSAQNPPQVPEQFQNSQQIPHWQPSPAWNNSAYGVQVPAQNQQAPQFSGPLPAIPQRNSFVAGIVCFGLVLLVLIGMSSGLDLFVSLGNFWGFVMLIAALAGGVELLLGAVRIMLNKPQPPAFVLSSLSFWISLFSVENRIIGIVSRKKAAQAAPAGQQGYPAPYPPPVQAPYQAAPPAPSQVLAMPVAQLPSQFAGQPQLQSTAPPVAQPSPNVTQQPVVVPPTQTSPTAPAEGAAKGIFCIACGETNEPGAIFCLSCGEKLYYPGAPQNAPQ